MRTISNIEYKQGDHPSALLIANIVKFDDIYTGRRFCSDLPKCVPIVPETRVIKLETTVAFKTVMGYNYS